MELYQCSKSNISEHIKYIFEEGELDKDSVVRKFRTTADAEKPFMGLTAFAGELPANAIEHKPMYMDDYVKQIVNTGGKKGIVESIPFLMPEKF